MDNELIQQVLNAVVEGLLPVIMALITLASYYLVKLIYTKTNQIKNEIRISKLEETVAKQEDIIKQQAEIIKLLQTQLGMTNSEGE